MAGLIIYFLVNLLVMNYIECMGKISKIDCVPRVVLLCYYEVLEKCSTQSKRKKNSVGLYDIKLWCHCIS